MLTVEFQAPQGEQTRIQLFSSSGHALQKVLSTGSKQQVIMQVSNQPSGLYTLEVATALNRQAIKVLKH